MRRASEIADPRVRIRARALLAHLEREEWVDRIEQFARASTRVQRRNEYDVLEAGALLLSGISRPGAVDRAGTRDVRDDLAERLRGRVRGRTAASCARAMGELLSGDLGFAAGRADFYDLDCTALDKVVQRRRGVPVALAIVYLLVGRRAGLKMSAVAMPNHFLVRIHGARAVLLDPARGGRSLTKGDCVRHLRARGYTSSPSSFLIDLDDREVLQALIDSLQRVFGYREDADTLQLLQRAKDLLGAYAS